MVIAATAQKQLRKVPAHIEIKLLAWALAVRERGLEQVRRLPAYHDEPLKGNRAGQRSVRRSLHYRAIYEIKRESVTFVSVEEVTKHLRAARWARVLGYSESQFVQLALQAEVDAAGLKLRVGVEAA